MDGKFVIFMAISFVLVAAIYSSSVSVAFAAFACINTKDQGLIVCTDSKAKTFTFCTKDKNGKWNCEKALESTNKLPPDLNNAINAAIEESQDTKEGPKTDLLDNGALLEENNTDSNDKVPKVPQDLGDLNDLPTLSPGEK
jgi:hypothetical protein